MYAQFQRLMEERGITPYKVSKDTGIAQSTLSDWKNGKITPKADKLETLAKYFDVSMDYFFDLESGLSCKSSPEEKEKMKLQMLVNKVQPKDYQNLRRYIEYMLLMEGYNKNDD